MINSYFIKDVYYKEKRAELKGTIKCCTCSTNTPKFVITDLQYDKSHYGVRDMLYCVKCAPNFFGKYFPFLISKNLAKKIIDAITNKKVKIYAKLCDIAIK